MEEKIKENNAKMMDAYLRRDFDALARLYDVSCQVMPAGAPLVCGSQAAGEFWKGVASDQFYKLTLNTKEVWGPMQDANGQTGIERGVAAFHNKQGELIGEPKYIVVWKKVGDDWKLFIDVWNSDK